MNASVGAPMRSSFPLWPAVLVSAISSAGFSIFKIILITEIALDLDAAQRSMPFDSMKALLHPAPGVPVNEALAQGLAAVLTCGLLIGYVVNAPLAAAWRCASMFVGACAGMALIAILAIPGLLNPWLAALAMGALYGLACAARGKVVPLLASAHPDDQDSTRINGAVNAGLVCGLLSGGILGSIIAKAFIGDTSSHTPTIGYWIDDDRLAHCALAVLLGLGVIVGVRLRVPDQHSTPFLRGMRDLLSSTATLVRQHAALLISGGIAWGVCTAFSLAVLMHAIQELHLSQITATTLGVFAGIGAIAGNLLSHRYASRIWIVSGYAVMALLIAATPWLIHDFWSGALVMIAIGFAYMMPTNVIDAQFLTRTHAEGHTGSGATVLSLVHNAFILIIGSGLSLALAVGWLSTSTQFFVLAGCTISAAIIAWMIPQRG